MKLREKTIALCEGCGCWITVEQAVVDCSTYEEAYALERKALEKRARLPRW
jgi:hypothetical protein